MSSVSFLEVLEKTPDRKSTRLNSSHSQISYAVFCLKKKSQGKGRNLVSRDTRKILFLLLVRAKKKQRLRNANGLVRGNERGQIFVPTSEQHGSTLVIDLR